MFVLASVTQEHRKKWTVMCARLLQVGLDNYFSWAGAVPAKKHPSFSQDFKTLSKQMLQPWLSPLLLLDSAGRCVGYGYIRDNFTLDSLGWLRCCVISKVGEKFNTTLGNYWQCVVLKSTADIVTLSTLKYTFGLENDMLMQSFVTACKIQVTVYFSQKHLVT